MYYFADDTGGRPGIYDYRGIGVLFAMFLNKKISLKTRGILQESMNTNQVGGVVRLVRKALIGTAVIEMAGALLLMIRFVPEFGFARGDLLWDFPCGVRFLQCRL